MVEGRYKEFFLFLLVFKDSFGGESYGFIIFLWKRKIFRWDGEYCIKKRGKINSFFFFVIFDSERFWGF